MEFAIDMAFEAFRLALTGKTKRLPPEDVLRWIAIVRKQR
jgi:hypothetical protein